MVPHATPAGKGIKPRRPPRPPNEKLVGEKFRAKEYQSFGNLVASLSKFSPV